MNGQPTRDGKKGLILAGGSLRITEQVRAECEGASLVVAADSGLRHALSLGLEPDAVVGDFDSVSHEDLAAFPELPRFRHPAKKDLLDLELAIDLALDRGCDRLSVLGAFGSRLDQSLAALLVALRLTRGGIDIALYDGERDGYPVVAPARVELGLEPGTVFSILAMEETICSVQGAAYPLLHEPLPVGVGLGLSNVAVANSAVEVHEGALLVIVERTLPTATAGID